MAMSIAALVNLLHKLKLLTPEQQAELPRVQALHVDVRSLARELIRREWLTAYQINQLVQGKTQELILGSYLLLERLGEGGMGLVFKARHRQLDRVVALKVIRKDRLSNPAAIKRFHREIQAAAALSHPNVVRAFTADQVDGTHFFAMEYIEGHDLAHLVRDRGPLPVGEACEYIRQAALGLQHAHEQGMVHRDIKPSNLLLQKPRPGSSLAGPVIKLLDMGLARLDDRAGGGPVTTLTHEGSVMGTPDYLAPEQALNSHRVDIRADIYSLGCTFYFLLTAKPPFPTGSLTEKLLWHQQAEPHAVEALRPEVPAAIGAVVRKMMAKRPEDRYQVPDEVVEALALPHDRPVPGNGPPRPTPVRSPRHAPPTTLNSGAGSAATAADPWEAAVLSSAPEAPPRPPTRLPIWVILSAAAGVCLLGCLGLASLAFLGGTRKPLASQSRPVRTARTETTARGDTRVSAQPIAVRNSLGMEFVLLQGGKFRMGSPPTDSYREADEEPPHEVTLTRLFHMGVHEVTQEQFEKVMGRNPSFFVLANGGSPRHPVENVAWQEAVDFCLLLSNLDAEKKDRRVYRLPTEAEWEYACRAGTSTVFSFGDDLAGLERHGWYIQNTGDSRSRPVGQLEPNAWGLHDMHGNVWEWCEDAYDETFYRTGNAVDPLYRIFSEKRVLRGGCWSTQGWICRSANRYKELVTYRDRETGFRVVMTIAPATP